MPSDSSVSPRAQAVGASVQLERSSHRKLISYYVASSTVYVEKCIPKSTWRSRKNGRHRTRATPAGWPFTTWARLSAGVVRRGVGLP